MGRVRKLISRSLQVTLLKRNWFKAKVGNQRIENRRENHDLGDVFQRNPNNDVDPHRLAKLTRPCRSSVRLGSVK
jgi:hypothetical protein